MWPYTLSGRLPVDALVGHYPTNKLIGRELIPHRKTFHHTIQNVVLSGIRPSFPGLSRSAGQITHVLLTRSPLEYPASRAFPFDLHVLSTPPAFVLSQDQTLHKKISEQHPKQAVKSPKPNKRTNHHKPHKNAAHAGVQKITTKKKYSSLNPTGSKIRKPKKLNTITCQPIHLNAAETPNSIQKGTCSTYPTGTHQPTNH